MPQSSRPPAPTDISLRPFRLGAGAALALIFLIAGIAFYIDPSTALRSQVGQTLWPWDYLWNGLYILGGLAVLAGRVHGHRIEGAEILGVCLLSAGWLTNLIAVLYVQGPGIRPVIYLVACWWGYSRYQDLLRGRA